MEFVGSRLVEGGLGCSRYRAELLTLVQVELDAAADTEHSPVLTRNRGAQAFADCERVSTKFFSSHQPRSVGSHEYSTTRRELKATACRWQPAHLEPSLATTYADDPYLNLLSTPTGNIDLYVLDRPVSCGIRKTQCEARRGRLDQCTQGLIIPYRYLPDDAESNR